MWKTKPMEIPRLADLTLVAGPLRSCRAAQEDPATGSLGWMVDDDGMIMDKFLGILWYNIWYNYGILW